MLCCPAEAEEEESFIYINPNLKRGALQEQHFPSGQSNPPLTQIKPLCASISFSDLFLYFIRISLSFAPV